MAQPEVLLPPYLLILALLLAFASTTYAQPDADRWINVRDVGASGSDSETIATTTEGSAEIVVADVGDFQVGQGVMVSRSFVRYVDAQVWGPTIGKRHELTPEEAELRGYDGASGSWDIFVIEISAGTPATFRWTNDLGLNWNDGGEVTGDWQPLAGGTEIKLNQRDWEVAHLITFSARDQLLSVIEKIERQNVYIPIGHYMISTTLDLIKPATIVVQGESALDTIIDISEGTGACVKMRDGDEVTLRNLRFVGNSGVDLRKQMGYMPTRTSQQLWGFYLKHCSAVGISNTRRVLCDNCHATNMSAEAFYSAGRSRRVDAEPEQYTREITYYRCSVEDCSRNAFNNNDLAENTSVLYCRIRDVGGCTWEGASRFVRFIGNYARNAGTVAMGNIRSRADYLEDLGTGQHIIADNVFETGMIYGGCAVRLSSGGVQTIVRNNIFVNYGTSAIEISGQGPATSLPSRYGLITGNVMDMTDVEGQDKPRFAIAVSAPDVIVSDNQIFVRGEPDANVTAIKLLEPMVNLKVHDNQITGCGTGISLKRATSTVGEVVDDRNFTVRGGSIPMERRLSHRYQGWGLAWLAGGAPVPGGTIEDFDPDALQYTLTEPAEIKQGASFQVYPTIGADWTISDNTISGCLKPVVLDSYGSETSVIRGNLITRGNATGVSTAVDMLGRFQFTDNRVVGFDEDGSSALTVRPDPVGRPNFSVFMRNSFERCANVVAETEPGAWTDAIIGDNLFIGCGGAPDAGAGKLQAGATVVPMAVAPRVLPKFAAARTPEGLAIDGDVAEWPWDDAQPLEQTPEGGHHTQPGAFLCAARDAENLYVAVRVPLAEGVTPITTEGGWRGDGVELSFRDSQPQVGSPIYVQWGSAGGTFECSPAGGANAAQLAAMREAITYRTSVGEGLWSCEWAIPLSAIAPDPAKLKGLMFNVGVKHEKSDQWFVWVGTGAEIFRVGSAGELILSD